MPGLNAFYRLRFISSPNTVVNFDYMKVSVIIPNYNHALFLSQRINAVLNQTFSDFEVIILDDCSTDSSKDVIEGYRDHEKITHIIYNEENSGGVFKQWIKGIGVAKGEYIWIAESDDYADPQFLAKTMEAMLADARLKMVFTDSYIVDESGVELGKTSLDKASSFQMLRAENYLIDESNLTRYLFLDMIITNASSALISKDVLHEVNQQTLQSFKNTGDRFVYISIALKHGIRFLDEPLNFMRSHGSNTTKLSLKNGNIFRDRLKVLSHYLDFVPLTDRTKSDLRKFFEESFFNFVEFCDATELNSLQKRLMQKDIISKFFYFHFFVYNTVFNKIYSKQIPIFRRGCFYLLRKFSLGATTY